MSQGESNSERLKRRRKGGSFSLSSLTGPLIVIVFIGVVIALLVGAFMLYRWFNWKFGYEDRVDQKIQQHIEEYHERED